MDDMNEIYMTKEWENAVNEIDECVQNRAIFLVKII